MSQVAPEPAGADRQPYKFLDYFDENDEGWFFGRERDVEKIVTRIVKDRISVLYGRSGVGKTSLLRAGVVPALRRRKYLAIYVRVTRFALADMAAAIGAELGMQARPTDLEAVLREASVAKPIVLVLDQLEEFFVETDLPGRRHEREAFVGQIKALIEDTTLRLRIAFSVREEYLARLEDIKELHDGLLRNAERLQPLTAFGAREAVVGPLEKLGIRYPDKLADRLVDALAEVGFETPTLQIVCHELYLDAKERDPAAPRLDEEALDRLGGIDGIYERYLDGVARAIPPEHQFVARGIVEALITRERTKRAATLEMLREGRLEATDEELQSALAALGRHRLIREEERGGSRWFELAHERVIPSALEWLDRDEAFFNFRVSRELIVQLARGERWRRQPKALLTADQLDIVNQHVRRMRLDPIERDFLVWSAVLRVSWSSLDVYVAAFPEGDVARSVDALLQHGDPVLRRAAATALESGHVLDHGGLLASRCLEGALRDNSREACHAAARAFARIARDEDLMLLSRAPPGFSIAADEVLTEVLAARLGTRGEAALRKVFDASRLRRLSKGATARILAEQRTAIRKRFRVGAARGLIGALAWALVLGVPLWLIFSWSTEPVWDRVALRWIPVTIGFALIGGPVVGAAAGAAGARDAALRGEGWWDRALRGARVLMAVALVPAAAFLLTVIIKEIRGGEPLLVTLVLALVAPVLTIGLASVVRAIGAGTGRGAALWCLASSTGPPLLAPIMVLWLPAARGPLPTFAMLGAVFLAMASFSALLALHAGAAAAPIRRAPPETSPPSRSARMIAAAPLGLALAVGAWTWDWRSVPFLAPEVKVTDHPRQLEPPRHRSRFGLVRYRLYTNEPSSELVIAKLTTSDPAISIVTTDNEDTLTPSGALLPVRIFRVYWRMDVAVYYDTSDLREDASEGSRPEISVQRLLPSPISNGSSVQLERGWQLYSLRRALYGEELILSLQCSEPPARQPLIHFALVYMAPPQGNMYLEKLAASLKLDSSGRNIGLHILEKRNDWPWYQVDRLSLRTATSDPNAAMSLACSPAGTPLRVRLLDPELRDPGADVALAIHVSDVGP